MTEEDTEQKWLEVTSRLQLRLAAHNHVVTQSGSVGVLSPLPTDSADSCWRVLC